MECDGILFDLDGTLWNATVTLTESWKLVIDAAPDVERAPTVAEMESVMGMTPQPLMATLFPTVPEPRRKELYLAWRAMQDDYMRAHGGVLYPHLKETLKRLGEKVPLAIVSNCNTEYIPAFLDAHELHGYFADWECAGRTGKDKWENILLVVQRNHLSHPVYVGDTALDRDSARMAGVPFIHAAYGFGRLEGVTAVQAIADLPDLLFPERS